MIKLHDNDDAFAFHDRLIHCSTITRTKGRTGQYNLPKIWVGHASTDRSSRLAIDDRSLRMN